MQRIHFTIDDLSNTRISPTVGPIAESIFSLTLLYGRARGPYREWQQRTHQRLGDGTQSINSVRKKTRNISDDLMWLVDQPPRTNQSHRELSAVLEVCRAAVVPYWPRIIEYLETEREAWGRIMTSRGMNGLLSTLHPKVRWDPPVLEIRGVPDGDVHLNGRGIQLAPSLFLTHRPCIVIGVNNQQRQSALAFATPAPAQRGAKLWSPVDDGDRPLAALVGQTRADALAGLREDPCTTGELAARLGISAAGASQHASVLRRAGLITTRRNRRSALHIVTDLGVYLLDGRVGADQIPDPDLSPFPEYFATGKPEPSRATSTTGHRSGSRLGYPTEPQAEHT